MQIAECDGGTVHDAAVVTDRGHAAHQRGPSTLYGGERRRWSWNSERRREAAVEPHREPVRRQPEQRVGVMGRSGEGAWKRGRWSAYGGTASGERWIASPVSAGKGDDPPSSHSPAR